MLDWKGHTAVHVRKRGMITGAVLQGALRNGGQEVEETGMIPAASHNGSQVR